MKKKNYILIGICGLILLASIGATYAFFSFIVEGRGSNISIVADNLKLIYTDTMAINSGTIEPGWSTTKTFTVENTSKEELYYKISWRNLINTFVNTSDLTLTITSTNGGGTLLKAPIPSASSETNKDIIIGISIPGKTKQEYTVTIEYAKTELDQSADMGKTLSGTIEIEALETIGDINILAWTLNGETQTGSFPKKDSNLFGTEVTCTNGATAEWNNTYWGLVNINSNSSSINCTVNFSDGVLFAKILEDNPNISTREAGTFNAIFTTSNDGNTIYKASGQDGKDTYYFAGNVTNNYVKFGTNSSGQELWWRIVRINEDNSVRLIYAGLSATDTAAFISTSQAFNSSYNMSYYVGYERSTTQHGTGTNSDIKGVIDTWYTNNLADEGDYLSKTAIYCNDRSTVTGGTWATNPSSTFYYDAFYRLNSTPANYKPVFTCTNSADKFTVSNTTGNAALENPIALITADEISYAGGLWNTQNNTYYIAQNASSGATYWWTMSPFGWNGSGWAREFIVGGSTSTGDLNIAGVHYAYGVRPVVSLKSCVLWSGGDGTSNNPYTVSISDTCATAEN